MRGKRSGGRREINESSVTSMLGPRLVIALIVYDFEYVQTAGNLNFELIPETSGQLSHLVMLAGISAFRSLIFKMLHLQN
jgi:hypothetical protein